MQSSRLYIVLVFLTMGLFAFPQSTYQITGRVFDKNTNAPLPFVNIVYSVEKHLGTTSDLDGRFKIVSDKPVTHIEFSYLGYKKREFQVDIKSFPKIMDVYMEADAFILSDVQVYAKENPAHRIVKQAIKNRKKNKPEALSSYQYSTYNKMFFSFDLLFYKDDDTLSLEDYTYGDTLSSQDSSILEVNKVKDNQYLFLMESISEKKYKKPGRVNEKILATRVSGFKNPTFALLGTQMQSFTVYSDYIMMGENRYLSPLAKNSTSKYLFLITDTIVHASKDTTYTLSYRPRKGKNFDGLEGLLQINTNGFAVENFSTKPTQQSSYTITIRQKYELVKDSAWFPTQLDADFVFPNILGTLVEEEPDTNDKSPDDAVVYGKAKTYIKNIELSPKLKNKEFSYVAYEITPEASSQSEELWNLYRVDSITTKEQNTYNTIDSLGQELGLEKAMKILMYLASGKVPMGFVSLQLDKLMGYNLAEGYRLGLGLETNEKLSKWFKLESYGAYGFGDKKWKYGGGLALNIRDYYDSQFKLHYKNDVAEVGAIPYIGKTSMFTGNGYRDFLIQNLVYEESVLSSVELRFLYYLKAKAYAKYSDYTLHDNPYQFSKDGVALNRFRIPEFGLNLRYAYQEHFMRTGYGIRPLRTKYPILYLNVSKSLLLDGNNLDYTKVWAKLEKDFVIRNWGVASLNVLCGYAWGDLPYFKLFNGQGSYYPFTILAYNSFGTVRMNEFFSDRFAYLFFRHNFGQLLFKSEWISPEFSLVHNMGWGDYPNPKGHSGINFKTMKKGYFESGIVVDKLLQLGYVDYGLGVFYRYGAYAFNKPIDNFAFKLSLKFSL